MKEVPTEFDLDAAIDGSAHVTATIEMEIPGNEVSEWQAAWDESRTLTPDEAEAAVRAKVEDLWFSYAVDQPYDIHVTIEADADR